MLLPLRLNLRRRLQFVPPHITQLQPGDVVQVVFKAGAHIDVVAELGDGRQAYAPIKPIAAKGFSRTVILGRILSNSPTTGTLVVEYQERFPRQDIHYIAHIQYGNILRIDLFTSNHAFVETAPANRPTVKALGSAVQPLDFFTPVKM